ncbi:MAG: EAL domain-containing protein [Deltaproteobacteria bacterium]|nr:EAL domain-containing protein [Deltaproteobacteria bacterium]MDQ3299695.1 EAL domain-containing protein [Myxococcota bacterium]
MSSDQRLHGRGALPPLPPVRAESELPSASDASAFAVGTHPHASLDSESDPIAELCELETKLDRCLAALTMHFQPIVHASTRARFGYEALLRSTDRSLPHPGAILDAAERLERIPTLGRAVRANSAKVIAAAPAERGVVFINLHLLDLFDKQLTSPFAPLSKVASRVVLEITERTSLEGEIDLRYRVAELRELGYRIAIDDLGGGHARMGTFSPLDTDFVKLDMSLVRDVDKHPMKQRLIRSIIELCGQQGTKVVGEGVETENEARVLVDLGCDLLQGYLIARPALPFIDPL